jgi:Fe-S oxidoreductase
MAECKSAYVATNGLPPNDRLLARIDGLCAVGSALRPLANWAIGNRQARWLMERTTGIAHGRKLPRFARQTFLHRAARRRLTRPARAAGTKVVFFVDTYANYFDVELAEAVVAVLEHNSVAVHIDPNLRSSAMTLIAAGSLERARQVASAQVERLAEAIRRGYGIVASEPSATLCLTREYPQLLGDDDSRLVAEHTRDAGHYLWQLHQRGRLRLDFQHQAYELAYHAPCHLLALDVGTPGENLLRLIPGLTVRRIEEGCSGMAGTFGLKRQNYRSSLRAGWGLISALRDSTALAGTTECCTCKFQMEQATSKPTVHPLKILALAYGRMPQIVQRLATPGEELVVT